MYRGIVQRMLYREPLTIGSKPKVSITPYEEIATVWRATLFVFFAWVAVCCCKNVNIVLQRNRHSLEGYIVVIFSWVTVCWFLLDMGSFGRR